jgi:hypothetical protein
MAEGGTTDTHGDTGHMVLGGLINTKSDGTAKTLNVTISYDDNVGVVGVNTDGFVCVLTNPSDFTPQGGGNATLTVSAAIGDKCFQMNAPLNTFSNVGNSLIFKGYNIGGKIRFVVTQSTLKDFFGDLVGNVAIAGEADPSGGGSNQAGGNRLFIADGGAVDTDDHGSPSGHMAIAALIALNSIKKNVATATAKSLDMRLEYQDFISSQHLSCHLTNPSDLVYALDKGVGLLTITVSAGDVCVGNTNIGNSITFALYVGGSKGRVVSTGSSLVDSDGDTIGDVAVVGQFSTGGGS